MTYDTTSINKALQLSSANPDTMSYIHLDDVSERMLKVNPELAGLHKALQSVYESSSGVFHPWQRVGNARYAVNQTPKDIAIMEHAAILLELQKKHEIIAVLGPLAWVLDLSVTDLKVGPEYIVGSLLFFKDVVL